MHDDGMARQVFYFELRRKIQGVWLGVVSPRIALLNPLNGHVYDRGLHVCLFDSDPNVHLLLRLLCVCHF